MSRTLYTCHRNDPLNVPAGLMWDHDIGCVAVTDGDGRALGMITDRDVCVAAYTRNQPLSDLKVEDVVHRDLVSCLPTDSLAHVERLMGEHQIRRVAVVDSTGKLVGLISQNDLVREAAHERQSRRKEVSSDEVVLVLDSIGTPGSSRVMAAAG